MKKRRGGGGGGGGQINFERRSDVGRHFSRARGFFVERNGIQSTTAPIISAHNMYPWGFKSTSSSSSTKPWWDERRDPAFFYRGPAPSHPKKTNRRRRRRDIKERYWNERPERTSDLLRIYIDIPRYIPESYLVWRQHAWGATCKGREATAVTAAILSLSVSFFVLRPLPPPPWLCFALAGWCVTGLLWAFEGELWWYHCCVALCQHNEVSTRREKVLLLVCHGAAS